MSPMDDTTITHHITDLVTEEQELRSDADLTDEERQRLDDIQVELDRCYDLLRQRRARREYGEDPDQAEARDAETVEHYDHVDDDPDGERGTR